MRLTTRLSLIAASLVALAAAAPALAAPSVSVTSPLGGVYTNATEVPVLASVSNDAACGRLRADFATGAGAVDVTPTDGVLSGAIVNAPEGDVRIRAFAWDEANCAAKPQSEAGTSSTVTITVDRTAPDDFALASIPAGCLTAEGGVALSATQAPLVCWSSARDGLAGVAGYEVWVDGQRRASVDANTRRAQLSGISAGSHSIAVVAYDRAGNARTSSAITTLLVDLQAPTVSWLQPSPKTVWLRRRVPLLAKLADGGGSGLASVIFSNRAPAAGQLPRAGLGQASIPSGGSSAQRVFYDTTRNSDGRYEWAVTAVDRAGNFRTVKRVVRIDNTRPRFTAGQRSLRVTGPGARKLLIKVRDAASPQVRTAILIRKGRKTVYRGPFRLARDTDVQKITIPARIASGRYNVLVSVKDLAGNLATKSFPLTVNR